MGHKARNHVRPNDGFWRQLRDLESVLVAQCVELEPPSTELQAAVSKARILQSEGAFSQVVNEPDVSVVLANLDYGLSMTRPFAARFLTVEMKLQESVSAGGLAEKLRESVLPGVVWHGFQ